MAYHILLDIGPYHLMVHVNGDLNAALVAEPEQKIHNIQKKKKKKKNFCYIQKSELLYIISES